MNLTTCSTLAFGDYTYKLNIAKSPLLVILLILLILMLVLLCLKLVKYVVLKVTKRLSIYKCQKLCKRYKLSYAEMMCYHHNNADDLLQFLKYTYH